LACARYGVKNGVERQFELRDISFRDEITEFSPRFERMRFVICSDCFDTEIGVRYVRTEEWSGKTV
jgi:hypothetical protein